MCANDSIYSFCNCWNALKAQGFFFATHEHKNIGIIEIMIGTWFIKKHLGNILGSYGRNTKKLSAYLEKSVS